MKYKLFIDKNKTPQKVSKLLLNWRRRELYREDNWIVVKNVAELSTIISTLGIPSIISFGSQVIDCAQCLLAYKEDYYLDLSNVIIFTHSDNPYWRFKTLKLFK